MSKVICASAMTGAREVLNRADAMRAEAIQAHGADHPVGFPDTAYYLPIIYSFTGKKVERLADLVGILQDCQNLLPAPPEEDSWLPYLGNTLDAGVATLFAFESIEACKTLLGPDPRFGKVKDGKPAPWTERHAGVLKALLGVVVFCLALWTFWLLRRGGKETGA